MTEKYSPNWLLKQINSAKTETHKLMYIVEYQNKLISDNEQLILSGVGSRRGLLIDAFNWYRQTSLNVSGYQSEDLADKFIQDN